MVHAPLAHNLCEAVLAVLGGIDPPDSSVFPVSTDFAVVDEDIGIQCVANGAASVR